MTRRSDAVREQLKAFRTERAAFREALRACQVQPEYVQAYKDKQAAVLRQKHHDALKVSAKSLWDNLNKNLSIARTHLAGQQQDASKRWDYQRLAFMQSEVAAKLAGTGGASGGPLGGGVLQAIAKMRQDFEVAGDFHGARALRTVALPIIATIKPGIDDNAMAANLRHLFAQDELSEIPAEVAQLESEIRALDHLTGEVELDIRQTEAAVTGRDDLLQPEGAFGRPVSQWDYDVFGKERPAPVPERTKSDEGDKKPDDLPKAQTDAEIVSQLYRTSSSGKPFGSARVAAVEV